MRCLVVGLKTNLDRHACLNEVQPRFCWCPIRTTHAYSHHNCQTYNGWSCKTKEEMEWQNGTLQSRAQIWARLIDGIRQWPVPPRQGSRLRQLPDCHPAVQLEPTAR